MALQSISNVCCDCRSSSIDTGAATVCTDDVVFVCYKGVSACLTDRAQSLACGEDCFPPYKASTGMCPPPYCCRQPFTIFREDKELRLKWGALSSGDSWLTGFSLHAQACTLVLFAARLLEPVCRALPVYLLTSWVQKAVGANELGRCPQSIFRPCPCHRAFKWTGLCEPVYGAGPHQYVSG